MKLRDIIQALELEDLTPELSHTHDRAVERGYSSDLLSDILAHAPSGGVAVTVQAHLNTVAVALHARLSAVIFAAGRRPEPPVLERATEEGVVLLTSSLSAFDLAGRLYALGLRGGTA
jgi:hypothetical protein